MTSCAAGWATSTRPGGPDAPPCLDGPVGLRVLIAEDEAIIRLDLRETLEEEGYEVVGETGRGDEAVAMARELSPDLAVLDIGMPGMDGLEAARLMVGEQLCGVLILTAFSQRELIEQARDAGALAYLVKPFQKSDLVPALELALRPPSGAAGARQRGPLAGGAARVAQADRPGQGPADGRQRAHGVGGVLVHPEAGHERPGAHA